MNVRDDPFYKLQRLWAEEDELNVWAHEMLSDKEHSQDQLTFIIIYMDAVQELKEQIPRGDSYYAIGGLYLRTFDNIGHGLRAAFSGNYLGAAMYARDLIETGFLLSYLLDNPSLREDWLNSPPDKIKKQYSSIKIRQALDDRDGFKHMKRAKHYGMLSTLGVHPTPQSFALKKDGAKRLNCGPMKHRELLDETIQELAKASILLGSDLIRFMDEIDYDFMSESALNLNLQKIRAKYFDN